MPDSAFRELRTARLGLRRFGPDDLDAFVAYRADPDVARYQSWEAGYTRAEGEAFLRWVMAADPDTPGEWFQFAIKLEGAAGLIGDCAARFGPDAVEIGFTIAPAHQRRGYATEAVTGLLGYVRDRGYRWVVAWCDIENVGSQRVLTRTGFACDMTENGEHRYSLELAQRV
jgi:RimJ/RimL family protein N-acetyltransferase